MLRVIGAGLGRTGTMSLKLALEKLLQAPCYHMVEVFKNPGHTPVWHAATLNQPVNWNQLFEGYHAAVDWPASAFWPEISAAYPDAIVLLSKRSAESWWQSASNTIFAATLKAPADPWRAMIEQLFSARFTPALQDKDACIEAYLRHNAAVRQAVPSNKLVEWTATDGWEPICKALNLPVPEEPFPKVNTTEEFQSRFK